jgi:hypothetical protein
MEHRLGHRVPARETVRVRTAAGEFEEAVMTDISLSGAFIHTRLRPSNLAPVHITLADSRSPSSCVSVVKALVVRTSSCGLGLEWWQFAPAPVMKRVVGRASGERPAYSRKERQPA